MPAYVAIAVVTSAVGTDTVVVADTLPTPPTRAIVALALGTLTRLVKLVESYYLLE